MLSFLLRLFVVVAALPEGRARPPRKVSPRRIAPSASRPPRIPLDFIAELGQKTVHAILEVRHPKGRESRLFVTAHEGCF
jgi:hypothetical protein